MEAIFGSGFQNNSCEFQDNDEVLLQLGIVVQCMRTCLAVTGIFYELIHTNLQLAYGINHLHL